jgi:hypothetical protein
MDKESEEFEINYYKNHIIIEINNQLVLIDTGAPMSIGDNFKFKIINDEHIIKNKNSWVTIENLSKLIGMKLDVLIGMDIISKYDIHMVSKKKVIRFIKNNTVKFSDNSIKLKTSHNIPYIKLYINEKKYRFVYDTGAPISYIKKELIENKDNYVDEVEDFSPFIGKFNTKIYNFKISISKYKDIEVRFGILPEKLVSMLEMTKTYGVIGNILLDVNYDILFSVSQNKFELILNE